MLVGLTNNTKNTMPTFKPVVSAHQRRADGSYNIKIRVTHKRVSRWMPTNLTAYASDLTRTLNIKNKDLEWRCNELIREMRAAIADLSSFALADKDVDWVVQRIKDKMSGRSFSLDFFAFAEEYLNIYKIPSTRGNYRTALNAFKEYLGRESIDINKITHAMILGFQEWVNTTPKRTKNKNAKTPPKPKLPGGAQSSTDIMKLAHIYHKAQDRYNDEDADIYLIPRNPFKNVHLSFPAPRTGQKALSQEVMQRIILADVSGAERIALDVFILSFCTMGANLVDLYNARPPKDGVWVYNRQKTRNRRADHAEMKVTIPPQAMTYCHRLEGDGEWWLQELHRRSSAQNNATYYVNVLLKRWAVANGLPPFTFYAARKTWATIARKAGVEKATIDECLIHVGELKMADIYIERDYSLLNEANRKVLAMFEWPMTE